MRQDFERPPALGAQTRKQKTGIQWTLVYVVAYKLKPKLNSMDKLMQKAMEKHKIVRYQKTFIDVMTTYKSLLEAENEQLHKPVVSGPASAVSGGGALLATEARDTGVSDGAGCPRCGSTDLYDVDDHWTKCQDCKFSFVG